MIRKELCKLWNEAALRAFPDVGNIPESVLERPQHADHGELALNLALLLAKPLKARPRDVAQKLMDHFLNREHWFSRLEIAGPGFINMVLQPSRWHEELQRASEQADYGHSKEHQGKSVLLEYVSANPTGPLHIGNMRGGPIGDTLARLLAATGWNVTREYYLNDVGGQVHRLGESIFYWWRRQQGEELAELTEGYLGEYVQDLAVRSEREMGSWIREQRTQGHDDEVVVRLAHFGISEMTREIREDLAAARIEFDSWKSEGEFLKSEATRKVLELLKQKGVTEYKEGALWLSVPGGDFLGDRECVLIRSNGDPTYFANDIAYHADKFDRGFDRVINVWGSNHHGHIPRVQGALQALGYDAKKLETLLYQYVRVKRGAEAVKMSKRAGNFVVAREVLDEVGPDPVRFFLLLRAPESHLDFDLELALKESAENPVYYVQYAHARICSIFRKAGPVKDLRGARLEKLELPEELGLIRRLAEFPEEVERAADHLEPQRIPSYVLELARDFQAYYTRAKTDPRYRVLGVDVDTTQAKLYLLSVIRKVLATGLELIGVSAPEEMRSDHE